MAATPTNEAQAVAGTQSITGWYDACKPMWIDLVGDYAGKELFLVEGDSLLRECFEDDRIDFDGKAPMSSLLRYSFEVSLGPSPALSIMLFLPSLLFRAELSIFNVLPWLIDKAVIDN